MLDPLLAETPRNRHLPLAVSATGEHLLVQEWRVEADRDTNDRVETLAEVAEVRETLEDIERIFRQESPTRGGRRPLTGCLVTSAGLVTNPDAMACFQREPGGPTAGPHISVESPRRRLTHRGEEVIRDIVD